MAMFLIIALVFFPDQLNWSTSRDELTFSYQAFGKEDEFDQVLMIDNDGLGAVAPTLEITPLDAAGQELTLVEVSTAFGSDRGEQVIPASFTEYDVLRFEGKRADEVRDVQVEIVDLEQLDYPEVTEEVTVERYFDDGRPVTEYDEPFDAVELRNPNDDDLPVKIALIAWAVPVKGAPEQFEWTIAAGPAVTVPANSRKTFPLPSDVADIRYVTVKTYSATS